MSHKLEFFEFNLINLMYANTEWHSFLERHMHYDLLDDAKVITILKIISKVNKVLQIVSCALM